MREERYLSAREAAGELGVSLPTLYAYVSRGLVRSEAAGGKRRSRRYRAEDVWRLKERKEMRRDPSRASAGALSWGMPVMESSITLISGGRLYYRGWDAVELARTRSVEEVAALIWTGDADNSSEIFPSGPVALSNRLSALHESVAGLAPLETIQTLLPLAASEDLAAYELRPQAVRRTGARILSLMAAFVAGGSEQGGSIAEVLRRGWSLEGTRSAELINAALVLCADHELPVSTFAARCVASSGATPYAAVLAGLAAMQGRKHGGVLDLVEAFLREVEASDDARKVIAGRLRRGDGMPGFGHSLYPEGDPRGAELMRMVAASYPESPDVALSEEVAGAVLELIEERPTVDIGLATLARALGLPPGGAITLFAVGRTIGWIGHAIEQYAEGSLIRPRTKYVGEPPRPEYG